MSIWTHRRLKVPERCVGLGIAVCCVVMAVAWGCMGCKSDNPGGGDAGADDAGSMDGGTTDGGGTDSGQDGGGGNAGVECGAVVCVGPQFCCTTDLGETGSCGEFPDGCGVSGVPHHCDGPEDCASSAECCRDGPANACLPAGTCDAVNGSLLCHSTDHCGGSHCCPASAGSPWNFCSDNPC